MVVSRAELLASGVLVAVDPELAAEAGVRLPLAMTRSAWTDCVEWNDTIERGKPGWTAQDQTGRLWDVLWMATGAVRRAVAAAESLVGPGTAAAPFTSFEVYRVPATGRGLRPRRARLVVTCGPGDRREPVLTITLLSEGPWRPGPGSNPEPGGPLDGESAGRR